MLLPYSSDITQDRLPWCAYLFFAAVLFFSGNILFENYFFDFEWGFLPFSLLGPPLRLILFCFYLLNCIFVLWVLSRGVCSRTGNIAYFITMTTALGTGLFLIQRNHSDILLLSWIIQCLAGMYLVFWPGNSIDCLCLLPPYRIMTITGGWFILYWVLFDAACCWILRFDRVIAANLSAFFGGIISATFLLAIRVVRTQKDEGHLWQFLFKKQDESASWTFSWSQRKDRTSRTRSKPTSDHKINSIANSTRMQSKSKQLPCDCGYILIVPPSPEVRVYICPKCKSSLYG